MTDSARQSEKKPARAGALRPLLDFLPALILCVAAVFAVVRIARAGGDTGTFDEWNEAASIVRDKWQVGDLIVFAPRWIDPVGRQHLGELLTIDDVARMDAARYQVVWELSIRGASAPEIRGRQLDAEFSAGSVRIRRYVGEPVVVVTDFRDKLKEAKVSGPFSGRPRLSLEEVGFEPHRCIKVVPRPGKTVVLDYGDVELGTSLVGYVGLADVFTRRDVRDPGALQILINDKEVASATAGVDDGWVRFEAETSPSFANVTFRITAVGPNAKDRRVCFAAEARR